ncbi:MAG TPA: peroxide stress protein YaaA [Ghiorsea sp.]|nr:peroxide stress protein YaaA [Ghiorsea sp.]HIP07523.1 peroxide stress protein YaaA [Mariprofundaceae bacterium]
MRIIISPAKKLNEGSALPHLVHSQPLFLEESQALINILQQKNSFDIAELMKLSMKLSDLNVSRYQSWHTPFSADNAKQALFSFAGDVYQGLDAESLTNADIDFAQTHLRILSGLYGLLRPLDLMQPYRLEMGTKLNNDKGNNLYDFWGNTITEQLNQELNTGETLVNLASNEYFKAIKPKLLHANIITPSFKENKAGTYKVVSIFAKKARGLMSRFMIENRITNVNDIKTFDADGYVYNPSLSDATTWVFSRG